MATRAPRMSSIFRWPSTEWAARAMRAIDDLIVPWSCCVCGTDDPRREERAPFCADCRAELLDGAGQACPRCGMSVGPYARVDDGCAECRGRSLGFDAAIALAPYQGPIRALCLRLKHKPDAWIAPWLVDLLMEERPALRAEARAAEAIVVPVPLHWWRLWERGYNQSDELAYRLAARLGLRTSCALRRIRPARKLAGLGRAERARLLQGAFLVRPGLARFVKGRTVFLVDDVLTTGATCGAAARALKKAGARRVVSVVIARAERDGGGVASTAVVSPEVSTPGSEPGSFLVRVTEEAMPTETLRIGSRGSQLALWQANWVASRLRAIHPGLDVTIVPIKTHGDRDQNSALASLGGLGLFTKEIQRALLDDEVDIAVHSLKDLPTRGPDALVLGAVPAREDVADALIAPKYQTLDQLPDGATVGTGSLRRRAQLLHIRPGLNVVGIRGNVETRLGQAIEGSLDAVVLAEAGLRRLGLERHVTERLGPPRFLPAVGQGALGIECRVSDTKTRALLAPLNDPPTRRAVTAERVALAELEGGCMIPLGAWGRDTEDGWLALDVAVFGADGRERAAVSVRGPFGDPEGIGLRVAQALRSRGAERLLRSVSPAGDTSDATGKGSPDGR